MSKSSLHLLVLVAAMGTFGDADARPDLIYREQSYTDIGTFDPHLSKLCAMRLFNQKTQLRRSAYFEKDRTLLGGATGGGWNLVDPTGAREFGQDYWFRNDGFSDCEVFFAASPRGQRSRRGAPAPR